MENIYDYIQDVKYTFIDSPVRESLSSDKNIPFKKIISHNLEDVMDNIDIIYEKPKNPTKILIIGEVKSGKSTLVNSIIEQEISEIDVLEATSSIINICYSEEYFSYEGDNGVVNIGSDIEYLKNINIVDTPGLRSITKENENKTLKYIQNADLILFVFDSTHIGQEDIKKALDNISNYGKPIIGVLNKADLVDDYEKVLEYAQDEYGIYINEFFVISAYLEYQHVVSKNAIAGNKDIIIGGYNELGENFNKLREYIKIINENQENLKINSIRSSIDAIMHKEKIYHYEYLKSIEMIENEAINHRNLLESKSEYIQSKMEFEINDWIEKVFLVEETNIITKNIDMAREYINEDYINKTINDKKNELDNIFFKEWNECIKEVNEITSNNIKSFIDNTSYRKENIELPKIKIDSTDINMNEMLATIGAGAILGATSGSIVAAYASGIGASAHTLTIGSAMLTYCPPLLIAGTLTGGIGKLIYDKLKNDQRSKDMLNDIDRFKTNIKIDVNNALMNMYANASKEIVKANQEIFESSKDIYLNEYELNDLKVRIQEYIKVLG